MTPPAFRCMGPLISFKLQQRSRFLRIRYAGCLTQIPQLYSAK
jgi:hypothetical protein